MSAIEVRVQVICFDGGTLLCARHRKKGHEYWVLPGGHLNRGETLWEAAVRELGEEAGIALEAGRLWAVGEFLAAGRQVVECTFRATAWRGEARAGRDPEGGAHPAFLIALDWLERARLEREMFLPETVARRLRERWDDAEAPAVYLGSAP